MKKGMLFVAAVFLAFLLALPAFGAAKFSFTFQNLTGAGQKEIDEGWFMKMSQQQWPNVDFKLLWMDYGSYIEKMGVMIASGDIKDMHTVNTNLQLPIMVDNDMVRPVDDLLSKYGSNIMRMVPPWHWGFVDYSGRKMGIINGWSTKNAIPYMRKDWLDRLGMAPPSTLEDYYVVMQRFTKNDPDGNGKDDTFGAGFREGLNWIDYFFHAFGVAPGHHHQGIWRNRAGRLEIDWVQPEMLEALKFLRRMYTEGLLIPDSITFTGSAWDQAFLGGRAGTYYHFFSTMESHQFALQATNPRAKLIPLEPPLGPGGRGTSDEPMQWAFVINKKYAHPEFAVEFHDWWVGPGWHKYIKWGNYYASHFSASEVGGSFKSLNEKGWKITFTPDDKKLKEVQDARTAIGRGDFYVLTRPRHNFYVDLPADERAFYEQQDRGVHIPEYFKGQEIAEKYAVTSLKTKPVAADKEYWSTLQAKYREIMTQIVSGRRDADEVWREWLSFWRSNGGDEITRQVNR